MANMVFRERILINSMLHLTFSMAPNIVFAPNIHRTQTQDARHKHNSFSHLENINYKHVYADGRNSVN